MFASFQLFHQFTEKNQSGGEKGVFRLLWSTDEGGFKKKPMCCLLTFLRRGRARFSNEGKSTTYWPTVYSRLPWGWLSLLSLQVKKDVSQNKVRKREQAVWVRLHDNTATWFWTGGPSLLSRWPHQSRLSGLPPWPPPCKSLQLPLLMTLKPRRLSGPGWFSPHLKAKQTNCQTNEISPFQNEGSCLKYYYGKSMYLILTALRRLGSVIYSCKSSKYRVTPSL